MTIQQTIMEGDDAQAALRYRVALRASADMWIWEMGPDLRFTYISDWVREISGIDPSRILGRTRQELIEVGGDVGALRDHLADLAQHRPFHGFVYRLRRSDGVVRHCRTSGVPVFDDNGRFRGYVGVAQDITTDVEAKRWADVTEAALDETQQRLHAVFNGTFGLIGVLSPSGWVLDVNRAALEMVDVDRNELTGRAFWETPWWTNTRGQGPQARRLLRAFRQGQFVRDEVEVLDRYGRLRTIDLSVKPIHDKTGKTVFFIVEGRDVTDRKQVEDRNRSLEVELMQSQKMEALGTLAGGIAHEINTPIQYIGDNLQFLKQAFNGLSTLLRECEALAVDVAVPGQPERLARIQALKQEIDLDFLLEEMPVAAAQSIDGIDQVRRIVLAIKDFSHPDTREATYEDLAHAIATTVTVTRNQWKYIADLETSFDPKLPLVPCHLGEINQVILNLIVNACHAIQARGTGQKGRIVISTRLVDGWAEMRVEDNGIGIAAEHRHRIFDLFFTTKPQGQGTGQGLAICQTIVVKKHEGRLTFESVVGEGATFIVRLPLSRHSSAADGMADESGPAGPDGLLEERLKIG